MSWIFIFHRGRIWGQFRVFSSHEAKDLNLTRNRFKFHYIWYNNYKQWKNIIFRLSFWWKLPMSISLRTWTSVRYIVTGWRQRDSHWLETRRHDLELPPSRRQHEAGGGDSCRHGGEAEPHLQHPAVYDSHHRAQLRGTYCRLYWRTRTKNSSYNG